jgi:ribose transport system substrate-binding protein
MKKVNWKRLPLVILLALVLVAFFANTSTAKEPKDMKFFVCQGWIENPSGQAMNRGYKDAIKEYGGEGVFVQSGQDPKKQSEQIEAATKMKPDGIFVAAIDTKAIAPAVQRAIDAGVPVFAGDSLIAGTACTSTIFSNNFGMGEYTGDYIGKRLKGKGNILVIDLPSNETWDMRALGLYWALRNYPDIKIVGKWSAGGGQAIQPRQAVDNLLTANPKKGSIDAIWCAWDGAAMEGALAIKHAGRQDEIFTTGIDGGVQPFEYIQTETPMALCMAQSMYLMAYLGVYYAHKYAQGEKVPRIIITPTYAVTKDTLKGVDIKKVGATYDMPGVALKIGWQRAL